MDEFTAVLVQAILARQAFDAHKCAARWCPHYDIECNEALELSKKDDYWSSLALEAIVKRGADREI
jgi:hypothetical protein